MDTRIVSSESQQDQITFGLSQDMGSRINMEDRIEARFLRTSGGLDLFVAMVADGIGGHNCGEVASKLTIQTTFQQISSSGISSPAQIPHMLAEALTKANEVVYRESREDLKKSGMGTTATLAVIHNNKLYSANVGDSRAYLLRDKSLTQITIDHTWAREMIHQGHLSVEEAEAHPKGGALVRSIGYDERVAVDLGLYLAGDEPEERAQQNQGLPLQENDRILLCSDGLIKERRDRPGNFVEDNEIVQIVSKNPPDKAAQALVQKAASRQADDNVSAVVAAFSPKVAATAVPRTLIIGVLLIIILLALGYLGYTVFASNQTTSAPTATPDSSEVAAVDMAVATAVSSPTSSASPMPISDASTTISVKQNKGGLSLNNGTQITTSSFNLSPGQTIHNNKGVSELVLADGSELSLDEASAVRLLAYTGLDNANQTVLEPQSDSTLLAAAQRPIRFQAPGSSEEYAQVEAQGIAVLSYSESPFYFELACLSGSCSIHMLGIDNQLKSGDTICVGGGCTNGSLIAPIAYEHFTHLSPLVPTPTSTPSPTATPTNTPTSTWIPTATPTNTPTPTPTGTILSPTTDPGTGPQPANTPEPANTLEPINTPKPADTPEPINTPEPADTPETPPLAATSDTSDTE